MSDLVKSMKKAALDAVNASNPVAVLFGKVVSENPLKINVEQKITLEEAQLILTRSVIGLWVDDEVLLLRTQGGQKFVVIDRLG